MHPLDFKSMILAFTAALGVAVSPEDFLGSLILALFGAALGAIWLERASA